MNATYLIDTVIIIDHLNGIQKAAETRRLFRLKLPDAFQAALAIKHSLRLATRNTRDFWEEVHQWVTIPYRL
ncbi:MAG: hypothetical protein JW881_17645 [Spirochaetales bacterium]|nr:hypothetical protein [Spirochaetales bacterium]